MGEPQGGGELLAMVRVGGLLSFITILFFRYEEVHHQHIHITRRDVGCSVGCKKEGVLVFEFLEK